MPRQSAILFLSFLLAACQNMPEPYMPSTPRQPLERFTPFGSSQVIKMSDPGAHLAFVKDIVGDLEAGTWRWAGKRPTVRIRPRSADRLLYSIDFTLPEATFRNTGPVTMAFYVDDHLLESVRYMQAGPQKFEKAIPVEWITPGSDVLVSAETDKVSMFKDDSRPLGFILISIGLKPAR